MCCNGMCAPGACSVGVGGAVQGDILRMIKHGVTGGRQRMRLIGDCAQGAWMVGLPWVASGAWQIWEYWSAVLLCYKFMCAHGPSFLSLFFLYEEEKGVTHA
jgi:hypothetical protein